MSNRFPLSYKRLYPTLLMTVAVMSGQAQNNCVIADMETHVPIRNVRIFTNKGDCYVTDYTGVANFPKPFESATVSHVSYLERKVNYSEFTDTIFLLPRENTLSTLTVWGVDRKNIKSIVSSATNNLAQYAPPRGVASFDFFKMFEKKPYSKKIRKKNEELLKNWDEVYGRPEEETSDSTAIAPKE